jgi:hypothetical protein
LYYFGKQWVTSHVVVLGISFHRCGYLNWVFRTGYFKLGIVGVLLVYMWVQDIVGYHFTVDSGLCAQTRYHHLQGMVRQRSQSVQLKLNSSFSAYIFLQTQATTSCALNTPNVAFGQVTESFNRTPSL